MANIQSQKKRDRQNEKRNIRNSQFKSSIRTAHKRVMKAVEGGESVDATAALLKDYVKRIDTAAGKGIVKKTTAARLKSRLAKKVNGLTPAQA